MPFSPISAMDELVTLLWFEGLLRSGRSDDPSSCWKAVVRGVASGIPSSGFTGNMGDLSDLSSSRASRRSTRSRSFSRISSVGKQEIAASIR